MRTKSRKAECEQSIIDPPSRQFDPPASLETASPPILPGLTQTLYRHDAYPRVPDVPGAEAQGAPTFDGVDYDDSKAFKAAQDAITREQWVGAMMIRIVGEELGKCYTREGVNHLEKCGHLRERYLQLLKDKKVKGTLGLQQNFIEAKEKEMSNPQ
ncbi:unnamed protein product [Parascedosporium putredinis]|uniref:NADH-ubiquinone oxidoreductase 12 kDa subunit n=1 Tax=Parascedosporium putredinis TaxID=1442378 RepID=A0A9P1H6A6_9PEZI|nr:unnamed protein product [Parascedosporium putredinis]CAI7998544.1 unnamed protein product [Parascedosporium putredinis]